MYFVRKKNSSFNKIKQSEPIKYIGHRSLLSKFSDKQNNKQALHLIDQVTITRGDENINNRDNLLTTQLNNYQL